MILLPRLCSAVSRTGDNYPDTGGSTYFLNKGLRLLYILISYLQK